ncbi:MAG: hypothetical protein Q9200_003902 [Gallowayella weberi]
MTVNVTIPHETPSLIRPLQRTFYPTKIPSPHQQLKNFISTADHDIIYYASERDIYALHLSTRKRESIASLPWPIQCLDARHGWICVGGPKNGRCAFISLDAKETNNGQGRLFGQEDQVDALLPLDLDPDSRMQAHSYFRRLRASSSPSRRKPEVQILEIGSAIVNSVTIHRLRADQDSQNAEIVCVLTDPDAIHTWQEIAELKLSPAPPEGDACFTTAFSPSGHVCAVAQQSGVVTVFDTSLIHEDIEDDDAVVGVLRSSRENVPSNKIGAVRSMSFSPAPWDLLAWAEDRGRICVADLRNACQSRQTLDLDLMSPNLNRTTVTDLEDGESTSEQRQLEIERRFLQRHREALNAQNDLAGVSHVADYIELSAARRRLQRDTASAIPGETNDLTESERQMLDSIRTTRSQENDRSSPEHDSRTFSSVNYFNNQNSDPSEPRYHPPLPALSSNSPSASAQLAQLDSMRDRMRRNHLDRSRTTDRGTYQPRRRSSVVISSSNNASSQLSSSHPSSLAPVGTSVPTLSASPSRLGSVVATAENAENNTASTYDSSVAWQTVAEAVDSVPGYGFEDSEIDQPRGQRREERNRESASASTVFRRLYQQQQAQQQQAARSERLRNNQVQRHRQNVQLIHRAMAGERVYENTELDMLQQFNDAYANDPYARREYGVTTMGIGWEPQGRNL